MTGSHTNYVLAKPQEVKSGLGWIRIASVPCIMVICCLVRLVCGSLKRTALLECKVLQCRMLRGVEASSYYLGSALPLKPRASPRRVPESTEEDVWTP